MPDRASVFAKAMMWQGQLPGYSPQYLVENFPWGSEVTTIVDVGGGVGHIAHALLTHNPSVYCIVQDRPEIVAQGENTIPEEVQQRLSFQAHDFFDDQPVHGADIYLLRHILHDWSNKYAGKILQALIPALKPGAKVVLNDRVVPGLGEVHYLVEREARYASLASGAVAEDGTNRDIGTMICICWACRMAKNEPKMIGLLCCETWIRDSN